MSTSTDHFPKDKENAIVHSESRGEGNVEVKGYRYDHNQILVNHYIEQIGFGKYQWLMFFTCGFGFLVDQMLVVSIGLVIPQIVKEWDVKYPSMLILALYVGSMIGAATCGFALDFIGRKLVWQVSLFMVTIWTMIAASSPNFAALAVFIGFQTIGAGGNIAIDLTVFRECLPKAKSWVLTALPLWWGVGNAVGGLLAWPILTAYSCQPDATPATCSRSQNMGWRYQYILIGGLCFVMAFIRMFLPMEESPKWLATQGEFEKATNALLNMAKKNGVSIDISVSEFQELRRTSSTEADPGTGARKWFRHLLGLFETRKLAISTTILTISWMCIGIAYPLFTLFLPVYLANNGAKLGNGSTYQVYRDYFISSAVGIVGPVLASGMVNISFLGRRRSLAITAVLAGAFAGAFTTVRNEAGNIGFSSMIGFFQNAFYAILYAYTPEVMPTVHRGTGCGFTLTMARIASLSSPFIATFANLNTPVPIWICLALYMFIALISFGLPFEPKHFSGDEAP